MKFILVAAALAILAVHVQAECKDETRSCPRFIKYCHIEVVKKYCAKMCGFCGPATSAPPPNPATDILPTREPQGSCGRPEIQAQRVIAGTTAVRGSWPWQVLTILRGQAWCGGSIISPRHIITAAHCVDRYLRFPHYFHVRTGEHNYRKKEGSEGTYKVKKITMHKDFQKPSYMNNDIAILEVSSPIQFNKYVQPICLPDKDVPVGTECYITGWGKVRHPGHGHPILQQARMPIVSNEVCHKKNFPSIKIPITDAMVCSGDGGISRKSGCHGDSGGPFVCQVNGRWELHGAVSHGSSRCDSKETYSVYARITYFKKWIENVMSQ